MSLKERITEDMKSAMRSGEKERLGQIRMLQAAIKQREVDERIVLDDAQVTAVLEKMIKQRREAITQFEAGGRADLAAKEITEIALLQGYLPEQLAPRRARSARRRGDRRERRRHGQGHGQSHGAREGPRGRPRRHGRRERPHQVEARHGLTAGGYPHRP